MEIRHVELQDYRKLGFEDKTQKYLDMRLKL